MIFLRSFSIWISLFFLASCFFQPAFALKKPSEITAMMQQAQSLQASNPNQAREQYHLILLELNSVIQSKPQSSKPYYLRAQIHLALHHLQEAHDDLQRASSLDPSLSFASSPQHFKTLLAQTQQTPPSPVTINPNPNDSPKTTTLETPFWAPLFYIFSITVFIGFLFFFLLRLQRQKPSALTVQSTLDLQNEYLQTIARLQASIAQNPPSFTHPPASTFLTNAELFIRRHHPQPHHRSPELQAMESAMKSTYARFVTPVEQALGKTGNNKSSRSYPDSPPPSTAPRPHPPTPSPSPIPSSHDRHLDSSSSSSSSSSTDLASILILNSMLNSPGYAQPTPTYPPAPSPSSPTSESFNPPSFDFGAPSIEDSWSSTSSSSTSDSTSSSSSSDSW